MPTLTRDAVRDEALNILQSLKENNRTGRSNKLADVKNALEPGVSLEFDTYFFFLRKFHYIAMDREAQLKLTDQGERVVDGDSHEAFAEEVGEFFADRLLAPEEKTVAHPPPDETLPPPPLPTDLLIEESEVTGPYKPPTPPSRGSRRIPAEDVPLPRVDSAGPLPSNVAAPAPIPLVSPATGSATALPGASVLKGTDVDLRYVKFDAIGSGPLGTVYKGRHNALGTDICVKELKDIFGYFSFLQRGEVIKRLKRELCAQAQVRHPGVATLLDQNVDVARPYFVMELYKGSLREKLEAGGGRGIPVALATRYLLQIAYAMRAAHAQGFTHHNVKPENVLLDPLGNARLSDFGLARVIEVDQSKGMPQVFVGTGGMGYMAPELISRTKDVGPSADVYAVGILLYEMLTGQIPGRRSPLPSEVNSEVPSKLDPIFDKMTHDRRESRYPDFDAMLEDFYGAFSDGEYLHKNDLVLWSEAPKT